MAGQDLRPGDKLSLNFGIQLVDPSGPLEWNTGPFKGATEEEALLAAKSGTAGIRYQTMYVRIIIEPEGEPAKGYLYWFKDGVNDGDLVLFSSGGLGETGPQGDTGPQGPTGVGLAGRDGFSTTIYPFGIPAGEPGGVTEITVTHSFGDYPLVQIVDSST